MGTVGRITFAPTPGPWRIDEHAITGHGRERVSVTAADGLQLADCGFASSKVAAANANLIAAAPDLLAALKLCLSAINEEIAAADDLDHPVIRAHADAANQADAAIAKAEGKDDRS